MESGGDMFWRCPFICLNFVSTQFFLATTDQKEMPGFFPSIKLGHGP